ncbi:MAG: ParB/RepB/Spo0J family partition protein [Gemmatimonadales bacterium]
MTKSTQQPPNRSEQCESDTAGRSASPAAGTPATPTRQPGSSTSRSTPTESYESSPPSGRTQHHVAKRISVSRVHVEDPKNARLDVDPNYIDQLAADIQRDGQLHPIAVTEQEDGFTLVAGNNRLLATKQLGWPLITAIIVPDDPRSTATIRLTENLTRANLSPLEEAAQLEQLVRIHPEAVHGVADLINRNPDWILGRLDLLSWPPLLQEAVHKNLISLAAGSHLARIQDPERQERYVKYAANHGITASTAALWRRDAQTDFLAESEPSKFARDLEENRPIGKSGVECKFCAELKPTASITIIHCCTDCRSTLESTLAATAPQPPPEQHQTRPLQHAPETNNGQRHPQP